MNKSDKQVVLTGGAFGSAMSCIIIASRAFQPNAIPMSEWSVFSWFLMLLPAYWPFVVMAVFYSLKFLVFVLGGHKRSI